VIPLDVTNRAEMVAKAGESSSVETAAHIERAAENNQDPAVAEELNDAAIAADSAVARVGWLRSILSRPFRRHTEPSR